MAENVRYTSRCGLLKKSDRLRLKTFGCAMTPLGSFGSDIVHYGTPRLKPGRQPYIHRFCFRNKNVLYFKEMGNFVSILLYMSDSEGGRPNAPPYREPKGRCKAMRKRRIRLIPEFPHCMYGVGLPGMSSVSSRHRLLCCSEACGWLFPQSRCGLSMFSSRAEPCYAISPIKKCSRNVQKIRITCLHFFSRWKMVDI